MSLVILFYEAQYVSTAELKSTLLSFGQIWACGSSTYYSLFPNLIPPCCHDNSIYTSIKNKGAFTMCDTHTKNKNHQCPEVALSRRHSKKGHSINLPRRCCFKFLLNQNQLDLTTALSSILSFFSHSFFTAFLPSPSFSAVLIFMQMQFWGCNRRNTFWYYGLYRLIEERLLSRCFRFLSLKWNGIQQNIKEILHLLEKAQPLFTYK